MPHYKATNNTLHFIESTAFSHLLPSGCIEITAAEAEVLRMANIPAPPAPSVVTMRQARIALSRAGLLPSVISTIASMPGQAGDEARIEWEFSGTIERSRPLVQSLAASLGLTEQQLDDLFTLASTL